MLKISFKSQMTQRDCLISQHNFCQKDQCCIDNPNECQTTCDPCIDQCNTKCNNIYGLTLDTGNCEFGCYVSCFEAKGRVSNNYRVLNIREYLAWVSLARKTFHTKSNRNIVILL